MTFKSLFNIVGFMLYVLAVTACAGFQNHVEFGQSTSPPYTELQKLYSFTENFVKVEIVVERDAVGNMILASTYTPTKAHFHLYSKDLPKNGIDGAGRPTLLEIPQEDKIRAIDQLFANQPIINQQIVGFTEPFPIYPDGPVTLRLPIQIVNSDEDPIQTQISVTYMTCSSQGRCLPPVIDKKFGITIASNLIFQTAE